MLIFVCIASTAVLSNSALGNPIPEDPLLYSDFPSENTVGFNDFETSSPIIPLDLTTHTPESSDLTFQQPLETSWLADSSAPPPDTTQLFADFSSNMPLETSLFAESSDAFLESSCGAAAEGGFQPYSKRDDDGICTTPKAEVNPMPVLKLPDLDILEKTVGSGQEELPRLRSFYIPRIPGFTVNDDDLCPKPNRRLCCQGPLTTSVSMGIVLGDCRGNDEPFLLGGVIFPRSLFLIFFEFIMNREKFQLLHCELHYELQY